MIEALRLCQEQNLDFKALFRFQYILSRKKSDVPGMNHRAVGRHHLYTGQSVHLANLLDGKGQAIGVVIGIAVDRTGLIEGDWTIPGIDADLPDFFDRRWQLAVNTGQASPADIRPPEQQKPYTQKQFSILPHSTVVLESYRLDA